VDVVGKFNADAALGYEYDEDALAAGEYDELLIDI
jgi:hypothetical protein